MTDFYMFFSSLSLYIIRLSINNGWVKIMDAQVHAKMYTYEKIYINLIIVTDLWGGLGQTNK